VPVDNVERGLEHALGIGLLQAAERVSIARRDAVAGREQGRNASRLCVFCKLNTAIFAMQPDVGDDQMHFLAFEMLERLVEIVEGRHHFIAEGAEHGFRVERGQRLILDNEDPLDDTLALTEQHRHSEQNKMTPPPQRTKQPRVPRRKPGRRIGSQAAPEREGGPQRIAKLLARAGIASRREIERMIAEGRIALDGETITTPATLLTDVTGLTVDGRPVRPAKAARLYRFYKPQATLTAERDPKGRATIYDRLPAGLPRLVPVGRLDFMTEGLLLLTNDGELKRQLELPRTGVIRTYRARAFGAVSQDQLERLAEGITIEGIHYGSIDANLERRTGRNCWIEMSLTEGKNREVRRVLAHLGLQVSRLIRTTYGPFGLAGLDPGSVDEIDGAELGEFRRTLK